jgi:hypothetical protein
MKQLLFVLPSLILSSNISFADSGLCEDAAKYTCSVGTHEDGTGSMTKGTATLQAGLGEKADQAVDKETKIMSGKLMALLKDGDNTYFRKGVIAALNMQDSPECQSAEAKDQETCNNNLTVGLTAFAKKNLVSAANGRGTSSAMSALEGFDPLSMDMQSLGWVLGNQGFQDIVAESAKNISNSYDQAKFKNISEKMFPQIKALLLKKISSIPMDEDKRKLLIDKVKNIRLASQSCDSGYYSGGLSMAFMPNAFYNPISNAFTVCPGILPENASDFSLAMVIGHELTHSIDPCDVQMGVDGTTIRYKSKDEAGAADEYPVKGFISCLRSEKSVGAKLFKKETAAKSSYGTTGGYSVYQDSKPFCDDDQIGESVADVFGDDMMAEYISTNYPNLTQAQWQNGVANVFRPMCHEASSGDVHPKIADRVNRILIQNPTVRTKMGCTKSHSKYIHCDVTNPDAMAKAVGTPTPQKSESAAGSIPVPSDVKSQGGAR